MQKLASLVLAFAAATAPLADAEEVATYRVRITNITPGQTFTPQLLVTHAPSWRMFRLGGPASDALAVLAEGGDTAPLTAEAESVASEVISVPGLLGPGESVTATLAGPASGGRLSLAAMLIPTNDTFVALNSERLPQTGSVSYLALAYDAGSEANDQNCRNIPGPRCGGEGVSAPAETDEGFVHVGNGFHETDLTDDAFDVLGPRAYDWRNPVARITVVRVSP